MDTAYPSFFSESYTPCHPEPSTNPPCTSTTFLTPLSAFPCDMNTSLLKQILARHPFANVGGTPCDANAPSLASHQESHRVRVHDADFSQIEDDAARDLLLDELTESGQLIGPDSSAHGQGRGAVVDETNDPEHRD